MFAMIATRPDLAFTVSLLGRFNSASSKIHLEAAKKTLRYLKHTATVGITYSANSLQELLGYCDSDWVGDLDLPLVMSFLFYLLEIKKTANSRPF